MRTILVIEDNRDVRENVAEILSLSNYQVLTAQDGRIGVETAINHQPDLILCDIMMPQMDGFGVIRILSKRQETADIPFIFLTAKTERGDFRRAMNLGADDYITKPFDDVELLDAIELRLEKSQRLRQSFDGSEQSLGQFMEEAKAYAAFEDLSKDREIRYYRKKDLIYEEGTYPHQLYFIAKGKVKIFKTNDFGKELIVDIHKEGEFLGYLPLIQNGVHMESAEALEGCEMRVIPKEDFLGLLHKNTNVAAQLIKMLANNITAKESQLLNLAYNSVRKRVAEALLQLYDRYESAGKAEITMLREDLASMTGTAKETVIRTLAEFKSDGLLDIKGSKILVQDKELLQDLPY